MRQKACEWKPKDTVWINKYSCLALTINTSLQTWPSPRLQTHEIQKGPNTTCYNHTFQAADRCIMESLSRFFNSALRILWDINQDTVSHSQTDTVVSNKAEIYQSPVIHFAQKHWQTIHTNTTPRGREGAEPEQKPLLQGVTFSRWKKQKPTVLSFALLYCALYISPWTALLPIAIQCNEYYRWATSTQVLLLHSRGCLGQPQFKLQTCPEFSKTSLSVEQLRCV